MEDDIKVKGFNFFRTYYELIRYLPSKDRLRMYDAMLDYVFEDKEPVFNGLLNGIWANISIPISNSKTKSKSGQTKNKTKSNQNQNEIKNETNNIPLPIINNNINNLESNRGMGEEKTFKKKFIKPTLQEIKDYCLERNNNLDVNRFYDFYESKGWKVGNQPMKDWKACIRTWERRTEEEKTPQWFDKTNKEERINESEKNELEEMLKEFK